MFISDY